MCLVFFVHRDIHICQQHQNFRVVRHPTSHFRIVGLALVMDHSFLNLADVPHFMAKDWINAQKQYPMHDTPYEVQWAKDCLLKVPEAFLKEIPGRDLPVTTFLDFQLPHQSAEIIATKAQAWFSHDPPSTDIQVLMKRPIPPPSFLLSLEKELGQAWFDGAKSVVDHRFNNSTDRLPFWVITAWKTLSEAVAMQKKWRKSRQWLDNEEKKTRDPPTIDAIRATRQQLTSLGWNSRLAYQRGNVSSALLAELLGTIWLSDEHINMMMEELSKQIATDLELADKIIIAPLAFSAQACAAKGKKYTRQSSPLLFHYEKRIREKNVEELYFPIHVKRSHWIVGLIDFRKGTISFGELIHLTMHSCTLNFGCRRSIR